MFPLKAFENISLTGPAVPVLLHCMSQEKCKDLENVSCIPLKLFARCTFILLPPLIEGCLFLPLQICPGRILR